MKSRGTASETAAGPFRKFQTTVVKACIRDPTAEAPSSNPTASRKLSGAVPKKAAKDLTSSDSRSDYPHQKTCNRPSPIDGPLEAVRRQGAAPPLRAPAALVAEAENKMGFKNSLRSCERSTCKSPTEASVLAMGSRASTEVVGSTPKPVCRSQTSVVCGPAPGRSVSRFNVFCPSVTGVAAPGLTSTATLPMQKRFSRATPARRYRTIFAKASDSNSGWKVNQTA